MKIGRYRTRRELGRGGQGVVLLAVDEQLGREVALKLVAAAPGRTAEQAAQRLRASAAAAARTGDPRACATYDVGVHGGHAFAVLRFVEGRSLAEEIACRLPLGPPDEAGCRRAAAWIEQAAGVIAAGHARDVRHGDLKPGNIMVAGDGSVVVLDFAGDDELGSLAYAAPERIRGVDGAAGATAAGDVYALGATLFELCALRPPFVGATRAGLEHALLTRNPPPVRSLNPAVSRSLSAVIHQALSPEPGVRYPDAAALSRDLERVREGRTPLARPAGPGRRLLRFARRKPAAAAVLAIAAAAIAGGIAFLGARNALLKDLSEGARQAEAASLAAADAARERTAERLRLADLLIADELEARTTTLWPASPQLAEERRRWIEQAAELARREPGHRARLEELRSRALRAEGEAAPSAPGGAPEDPLDRGAWERSRDAIIDALADDPDRASRRILEQDLERVEAHLAASVPPPAAAAPVFADEEDRFRHDALARLVAILERIRTLRTGDIRRRDGLADELERRAREDGGSTWERAAQALAKDPRFAGIDPGPLHGLLPLGPDPASGLWEFAHLPSGAAPHRNEHGALVLDESSAIVLVLLPAAAPRIGATGPEGQDSERPAHSVPLAPFLIGKHEITNAQWRRCLALLDGEAAVTAAPVSGRDPASRISHDEAVKTLRAVGLELPSEAQWECAARRNRDAVVDRGRSRRSREGGERPGRQRPRRGRRCRRGGARRGLRRRLRGCRARRVVPAECVRALRRPRQRVGALRGRVPPLPAAGPRGRRPPLRASGGTRGLRRALSGAAAGNRCRDPRRRLREPRRRMPRGEADEHRAHHAIGAGGSARRAHPSFRVAAATLTLRGDRHAPARPPRARPLTVAASSRCRRRPWR